MRLKKPKIRHPRASLPPAAVRRIIKYRTEKNWSQQQLAAKFGTSQTTISNIFRGIVYGRITGIASIPRKRQQAA